MDELGKKLDRLSHSPKTKRLPLNDRDGLLPPCKQCKSSRFLAAYNKNEHWILCSNRHRQWWHDYPLAKGAEFGRYGCFDFSIPLKDIGDDETRAFDFFSAAEERAWKNQRICGLCKRPPFPYELAIVVGNVPLQRQLMAWLVAYYSDLAAEIEERGDPDWLSQINDDLYKQIKRAVGKSTLHADHVKAKVVIKANYINVRPRLRWFARSIPFMLCAGCNGGKSKKDIPKEQAWELYDKYYRATIKGAIADADDLYAQLLAVGEAKAAG